MSVACFDGHLDRAQDSGMMCIGERLQLRVLTVQSACVLGQVVCAQGEEINFFCQLIRAENSGGCLDHDTDLDVVGDLVAFLEEFLTALFQDFLTLADLSDGDDHREHDAQVAVRGSTQQGTQLCLEERLPGQADTDCTIAKSGVLFLIQVHVFDGLVSADITCTDDDKLGSQGFQNSLVSSELLFFAGLFLAVEVYELGTEQAYAFRVVLVNSAYISGAADVGVYMYVVAVDGL